MKLNHYNCDHLGNMRVTFTDSANVARSLSENHYYPFGMSFAGIPQKQTGNLYLYNGKELQNDFGLDWYDYGARFYDGAVGRWWSVDPLAEKYVSWTQFNYCVNNPINAFDPNGATPFFVKHTNNGNTYYTYYNSGKNTDLLSNTAGFIPMFTTLNSFAQKYIGGFNEIDQDGIYNASKSLNSTINLYSDAPSLLKLCKKCIRC